MVSDPCSKMPRLTTRKCDSTSAKGPPASSAFWSFRAADLDRRPASQEFLAQLLVPYDPSCIPTAARSTFENFSLLLSRLKLSLFDKMGASEAGPGVGFEFPRFDVAWKKRDLLLFASSIGATYPDELHFLYVRSSFPIRSISSRVRDCSAH